MKKMVTELSLALLTTVLFSQGGKSEDAACLTYRSDHSKQIQMEKMALNRNGALILILITGLTAVHVGYYRYLVRL